MSTFALSMAGFVLSIVANLWTFGLTFVRWPCVSVETRAYLCMVGAGEPSQDKIVLTVINRGSEAVTIGNLGLRAADGSLVGDFEYDELHYPDRSDSHRDPLLLRMEGHGAFGGSTDHTCSRRSERAQKSGVTPRSTGHFVGGRN